jgi:2,3-bisphosphoglycerate-independent phosphoglycerate mutase
MTVPAVCLVILDGWGIAPEGPGNAVALADTPVFDALWAQHPHTQLIACGEAVGLPAGQMGNSEVGHLNLGAGAVVPQDLMRIDQAVADGSLADSLSILDGFDRVHLIGLVSDGGVHSSDRHLAALVGALGDRAVVHAFTDGRDTSPTGGERYLAELEAAGGRVASVIGRYYAMDRDNRPERTQAALDLLLGGKAAHQAPDGPSAARAAYAREETDEFIAPTVVGDEPETIAPGDAVLAFNFRPDRMRQLTDALAPQVALYVTMTEYAEGQPWPVLFPPRRPDMTIARVIADHGLAQLHVAETEKYPHVTYFFNGGEETPYPREERQLVPSPRDVPTYDYKPEMSAPEATEAFLRAFEAERPAFSIINFANPDMVGHTGVIPAAVRAIETVDACLGRVVEAVHAAGGACIVTADHGNADEMLEEDGSPDTAHSLNPVPFVVTAGAEALSGPGILADVAPTALALLGITQPPEMTGRSLLAWIRTARPGYPLGMASQHLAPAGEHELSDTELDAWRGFLRVHSELTKALDAELETKHGLPLTSYEVLIYLAKAPEGRLRMAELADRVLLSRSGMTRLVDRLEREGLIRRDSCADDKRGAFAVLTDAGAAVLSKARPDHLEAVRRRFLAHFEEAELQQLRGYWGRLVDLSPSD